MTNEALQLFVRIVVVILMIVINENRDPVEKMKMPTPLYKS